METAGCPTVLEWGEAFVAEVTQEALIILDTLPLPLLVLLVEFIEVVEVVVVDILTIDLILLELLELFGALLFWELTQVLFDLLSILKLFILFPQLGF